MEIIYENFTDIAESFIDGDKITHVISDHKDEDCFVWQSAILEFAKWMDKHDVKLGKES